MNGICFKTAKIFIELTSEKSVIVALVVPEFEAHEA